MQNTFTNLQNSYIISVGDNMKEKLVHDIDRYIAYLNNAGLFVSVHGKGIGGLLKHNVHNNPFCAMVKIEGAAWGKCIHCQQKVFKEYKRECFFGMCYAGVEEYVFFVNDKTFVSVSGYGINKEKAAERIRRLSREFYLNKADLLNVYENSLKHEKEDMQELAVLIRPLCHMLSLLQILIADISETQTQNTMVDSLLAFVQNNFMRDITIRDVAQACACSESTVCHLFKQRTGLPIKKYIADLRLSQAKKLLSAGDLPISTVALMCGFSNINYFPTAFKKHTGITPTEYRLQTNGS